MHMYAINKYHKKSTFERSNSGTLSTALKAQISTISRSTEKYQAQYIERFSTTLDDNFKDKSHFHVVNISVPQV